jgi:uncharacterized membrane protein
MRLYLALPITIAEKVWPWTAISESFASTKGHVWQLILLLALNIGIFIVSCIPLGLGLIWALPYGLINLGMVYRMLRGDQTKVESNPTLV